MDNTSDDDRDHDGSTTLGDTMFNTITKWCVSLLASNL